MKKIYLIVQIYYVSDKPEYLQEGSETQMYAFKNLEEAKKEIEVLQEKENKRKEEFRKLYRTNPPAYFKYQYKSIYYFEK